MSDRVFNLLIGVALVALLAVCAVALWTILQAPSQRAASPQPSSCQTFPETGKTVCGRFLTYWREHGGLPQQGYPISGEFQDTSPINGKAYTTQYFERAVFEYHPENQAPFDVLLALLGTLRYQHQYKSPPQELTDLPAALHPAGGVLFRETGKALRGLFLDYWLAHGGPMQYGYPIANPFMETSEGDGQEYLVQYFERAEFELHPENQAPYNVLPGLLGSFEFKRKYPAGDPSLATPTPHAVTATATPRR